MDKRFIEGSSIVLNLPDIYLSPHIFVVINGKNPPECPDDKPYTNKNEKEEYEFLNTK